MIIGSVLELLRMAAKQQEAGFSVSATWVRGIGSAEAVLVTVSLVLAVGLRSRQSILTVVACVLLLTGVADVVIIAQAGIIP
ncbi:MAG TPA: hypothetical protein VIO62_01765 [Candidatus Dormibacteraeota bacterium]|jgi:hypothetical protein